MNADPELIAARNAEADASHYVEMLCLVVDLTIDKKMVFVTQLESLWQRQTYTGAGKIDRLALDAAPVRQHDDRGTLFWNANSEAAFILPRGTAKIVTAGIHVRAA